MATFQLSFERDSTPAGIDWSPRGANGRPYITSCSPYFLNTVHYEAKDSPEAVHAVRDALEALPGCLKCELIYAPPYTVWVCPASAPYFPDAGICLEEREMLDAKQR